MSDFERSEDKAPEDGLTDENGVTDENPLTPAQEKAVAALLSAPTLECAAQRADISPATLRRWRHDPHFAYAVRTSRLAVLDAVTMSLREAAQEAAQTLRAALSCDRPADRIRAAQIILETAYRSAEIDELAARMDDFDEHLKATEELRKADEKERAADKDPYHKRR